jgi:hypothetical protein
MAGFGDELLILRGPTGITDQSANGNNGTFQGGMGTVADTTFGGVSAFAFDGSNDFITLPTIAISKSLPFSVGCWFRTAASGALLSDWNLSIDNGWMFDVRGGFFNYLQLGLYSAGGDSSYRVGGTTVVTDNQWHLGVATYDGTNANGIRIYLDGSAQTLTPIANSDPGTLVNGFGRVGSRLSALLFNGRQDDVRLFNRVLTPTEISDWWDDGRGYDLGGGGIIPILRQHYAAMGAR